METQQTSPDQYLRTQRILHFALLAGQIMFIATVVGLELTGNAQDPIADLELPLLTIVPLAVAGGLVGSILISKNRLASIRQHPTLSDKLADHRSLFVVKAALLEGPAFLSIISYMLTGNWLFIGIASVVMILFLLQVPTMGNLTSDLELTSEEKRMLEGNR